MSHRKIIFFDIDGTLWDHNNTIPDSTVRAFRELRKNGHLLFICTGRARGFVNHPDLLALGFDGIISACGTMIEYRDEIIYLHEIDKETAIKAVSSIKKHRLRPILEGKENLYMDYEEFRGDWYGEKVRRDLGGELPSITGNWGNWHICKISCDTTGSDREACFEELKDDFDFIVHGPRVTEMVPKGFNKGTGVRKTCELLGINIEDTVCFGDGVNDLDMFRACRLSICMGSGSDVAKGIASYVTDPLFEDGVYNACRYFNLI
ncbi:MAG: Cof-type HAD-IIB family hydrolase [Oscillospiraceae bacterium]|nr:Cof-type HAD-IIB family hydrolase [Oscillospiraceae bacterium]